VHLKVVEQKLTLACDQDGVLDQAEVKAMMASLGYNVRKPPS
jgi:hypothetical protein